MQNQQHVPQTFTEPKERRKVNWITSLRVWSFLGSTMLLGRKKSLPVFMPP